MNIYEHRFCVTCPNDSKTIHYMLRIETESVVMAEAIEDACRLEPTAYHESIADTLFQKFGGKQTITARHGAVDITTVRNAA